jgi:hypothetical protein
MVLKLLCRVVERVLLFWKPWQNIGAAGRAKYLIDVEAGQERPAQKNMYVTITPRPKMMCCAV